MVAPSYAPDRSRSTLAIGVLLCLVSSSCTDDGTRRGCARSSAEGATYYSQGYEDYILSQVFGDLESGSYVDVGANHPENGSVTKLFYDKGWRGMNIDANPQFRDLYTQRRPHDINLFVGIAREPGTLMLFRVSDAPGSNEFSVSGLTTFDASIAAAHRNEGFRVRPVKVPVERLDEVLARHQMSEITFLNVDVEGFEQSVLASIDFDATRPKVVVVEATFPLTQIPVHDRWEGLLTDNGYVFVMFDGLNRYYVSDDHLELLPRFTHVEACVRTSRLSASSDVAR